MILQIGNGYYDGNINRKATFDYYWTHALISDEAYRVIQSMCTFANQNYSVACEAALRSASAEIGPIDHYNIYAPLCRGPSGSTSASVRFIETNLVYGKNFFWNFTMSKVL